MIQGEPLISIVTVVLNNRSGLDSTEKSISCQTSKEFEWVVVDGGSQDGSLEIVRNCSIGRVKCVSEPDQGIYDAMNKGITMSSGEYVLFLNSGDHLADTGVIEDLTQLVGTLLAEQPKPVITGGVNLVLAGRHKIYKAPRLARYIWHSTPAYHQATAFPLDFLKDHAYDTSYVICGDYYIGALAHVLGREFVSFDRPISDFEVGGFSYQHPLRQVREAMRVQRSILGLGPHARLVSALYRVINVLGTRLLAAGSSIERRVRA